MTFQSNSRAQAHFDPTAGWGAASMRKSIRNSYLRASGVSCTASARLISIRIARGSAVRPRISATNSAPVGGRPPFSSWFSTGVRIPLRPLTPLAGLCTLSQEIAQVCRRLVLRSTCAAWCSAVQLPAVMQSAMRSWAACDAERDASKGREIAR